MANGDTLIQWRPASAELPTDKKALLADRNGYPTLVFPDGVTSYALFSGFVDARKSGGNYKVEIVWAAKTQTSGNVRFQVEAARFTSNASGFDLDEANWATAQAFTSGTAPGAAGRIVYQSSGSISNANMDSVAADEMVRLRIARLGADALDTLADDIEVLGVRLMDVT
jgi:hypothetical protein